MPKERKFSTGEFKQQPVRTSYSELRLAIEARLGGNQQADEVHRKWKRLGKLASQGPASLMK